MEAILLARMAAFVVIRLRMITNVLVQTAIPEEIARQVSIFDISILWRDDDVGVGLLPPKY